MPNPQKREKATYTYKDYCCWSAKDGRFELIDGVEYSMTPGPSRSHSLIVTELGRQFANFFLGKSCEVHLAPFDVRFSEPDEADEDISTVVQPDISIICDPKKLDEKGCRGAPDLVVEILSPSTASKDHIKKRAIYEKHGVKEYWLVHPTDRTVMVYRPDAAGKYNIFLVLDATSKLSTPLFPGLEVDLGQVFQIHPNSVKESSLPYSPASQKTSPHSRKKGGKNVPSSKT